MLSESTEDTSPASLSGMRKAVDRNTAKCDAALEWSAKAYHLLKPVADNMARSQRDSRNAVLASGAAVFFALLGIALEFAK